MKGGRRQCRTDCAAGPLPPSHDRTGYKSMLFRGTGPCGRAHMPRQRLSRVLCNPSIGIYLAGAVCGGEGAEVAEDGSARRLRRMAAATGPREGRKAEPPEFRAAPAALDLARAGL